MRRISVIVSAILLHGCATVGEGEFSCSGIPDGTRCEPSSGLYNEVDRPSFDSGSNASVNNQSGSMSTRRGTRHDTIGRNYTGRDFEDYDNRSGKKGERYFGKVPTVSGGSPDQLLILNPPGADKTQPQRMAPNKRQIWIAPWVDRDDVYHGSQLLFVDIETESWKNGEDITGSSPIFSPLN
jgi:type IV conjugative transfer system lipoprotein TraV